jgi:SAM-dependent methyltransferase
LILGESTPYEDGAEAELLDLFTRVTDLSSGSEELTRHIHDWPTRYHLAGERENIVAPVRIDAADRVVDVGAGTGAIARAIGESGASVLAVEGNLSRARAVARRCAALPNVRVAVGSIAEYDDDAAFDVALSIGVLEYAGAQIGDSIGPRALLDRVRTLLKPDGVLVLAIENQLGLRYLLGAPEDHLGVPYAGIEGYRDARGIRTYSRRVLTRLLRESGFEHQQWLFPFPDYKLPHAIVSEQLYSDPTAWTLLDALVPDHVGSHPFNVPTPVDVRAFHRTLVEAGLGPDVANSFLVVASPTPEGLKRVDPEALVWRFDNGRLRRWQRTTVVRRSGGDLLVERAASRHGRAGTDDEWLHQRHVAPTRFLDAPSLETLAVERGLAGDVPAISALLVRWLRFVSSFTTAPETEPVVEAVHPFSPQPGERALPGRFLDSNLGNFVIDGESVVYVDDEWEGRGSVSLELVVARAAWWLALTLVRRGATRAWPADTTVNALATQFASECGVTVDAAMLERLRVAEAQLQSLVTGADASSVEQALGTEGTFTTAHVRGSGAAPVTGTDHEVARLRAELARVDGELHRVLDRLPMRVYLALKRAGGRLRPTR